MNSGALAFGVPSLLTAIGSAAEGAAAANPGQPQVCCSAVHVCKSAYSSQSVRLVRSLLHHRRLCIMPLTSIGYLP